MNRHHRNALAKWLLIVGVFAGLALTWIYRP